MLLVSTVSNLQAPFVQLEALVSGINGSWGPGIYLFINRLGSSRWIYEVLSACAGKIVGCK